MAKTQRAESIDENAQSADAQYTAKPLPNRTVCCSEGMKQFLFQNYFLLIHAQIMHTRIPQRSSKKTKRAENIRQNTESTDKAR